MKNCIRYRIRLTNLWSMHIYIYNATTLYSWTMMYIHTHYSRAELQVARGKLYFASHQMCMIFMTILLLGLIGRGVGMNNVKPCCIEHKGKAFFSSRNWAKLATGAQIFGTNNLKISNRSNRRSKHMWFKNTFRIHTWSAAKRLERRIYIYI